MAVMHRWDACTRPEGQPPSPSSSRSEEMECEEVQATEDHEFAATKDHEFAHQNSEDAKGHKRTSLWRLRSSRTVVRPLYFSSYHRRRIGSVEWIPKSLAIPVDPDVVLIKEQFPEDVSLAPLVRADSPAKRGSSRHFHCVECWGFGGSSIVSPPDDCCVQKNLTETDAARACSVLRERLLDMRASKRLKPSATDMDVLVSRCVENVEDLLERAHWADHCWDEHLCRWASTRFPIYAALLQLKLFGHHSVAIQAWHQDLHSEKSRAVRPNAPGLEGLSTANVWSMLDSICGKAFSEQSVSDATHAGRSGNDEAHEGNAIRFQEKKLLLVGGDREAADQFSTWGWTGVVITESPLEAETTLSCQGGELKLLHVKAGEFKDYSVREQVLENAPSPELLCFDDAWVDSIEIATVRLCWQFLTWLKFLQVGGTLVVRLTSLPRLNGLAAVWHLSNIFGPQNVRIRKPTPSSTEGSLSSFYCVCQNFPGIDSPAVQSFLELCATLTSHCHSCSAEAGTGPFVAYPGHLPLPRNVMVKALCALCEALTKDLKPYWCKQAHALKEEYLWIVRELPKYRAMHRRQSREIAVGISPTPVLKGQMPATKKKAIEVVAESPLQTKQESKKHTTRDFHCMLFCVTVVLLLSYFGRL